MGSCVGTDRTKHISPASTDWAISMANSWADHGIGLGGAIELRRDWAAFDADAGDEYASADDVVRLKQASLGSVEVIFYITLFRVSSSTSMALMLSSVLQCSCDMVSISGRSWSASSVGVRSAECALASSSIAMCILRMRRRLRRLTVLERRGVWTAGIDACIQGSCSRYVQAGGVVDSMCGGAGTRTTERLDRPGADSRAGEMYEAEEPCSV
jgi:hypothetical protein